jgi:dolichyl-phosphooligosaccharide-protein glycotransferase
MKALRLGLLAAALALVGWVRLLPLGLDGVEPAAAAAAAARVAADVGGPEEVGRWVAAHRAEYEAMVDEESRRRRDFLSRETVFGRPLPYLGGFDSYVWLRAARNVLRHGSPCDSVVDGECRDDYTLAPVGTRSRYASSFHVRALVVVHRVLSWLEPTVPLALSAFLLSFLVGLLGVFPAFWLGTRFGGAAGGFLGAVLVSFNTTVLYRSFGADNDVWNVVLPLFEVWAAVEAIYAEKRTAKAVYVAIAAAVTGLHAVTWAGWILTSGIVVLGLAANALLWGLRRAIHGARAAAGGHGFAGAAAVAAGYLIAASAVTWAAGASASPLSSAAKIVGEVFAGGSGSGAVAGVELTWPSVFATVGELRRPNLAAVAQSMAGPVYFFVAWLGLILLMLPRSGWQPWHFAILVVGNLLYRFLLSYSSIDPWTLAALLLLPLAVALGAYLADGDSPVEDQGAGAMIILWFLAGLLLSFRGHRFLIVLAPPLGVLCAVAGGRLYQWVERRSWAVPPLRLLVLLVLLATAYPPIARGERIARSYLPIMNDAWYEALDTLRQQTSPDSVVNTWWDYGYFVKHIAERRVLSDGGTLATHVHYWFSRAMIAASEAEALGLLRMLNCGSDAFPEPEGRLGAFGALLEAGVAPGAAVAAIVDMASMDRGAALAHLRGLGVASPQAEVVLRRTHCRPAPAYLVLPDDFARSIGWRSFGTWSFLDASAAALRGDAAKAAPLASFFGVERDAADAALRRAREAAAAPRRAPAYLAPRWFECSGTELLRCAVDARLPGGELLRSVAVPVADPAATRLLVRDRGGAERELAPRSVILPAPDEMEEIEIGPPDGESVLVDLGGRRVLVGTAEVLRSVTTRLLFLGDDHLERFAVFGRQRGLGGDVTTWRVLW